MIRKGKWKYVYYFDAPNQLFDLDTDPNELMNLIENKFNCLPYLKFNSQNF